MCFVPTVEWDPAWEIQINIKGVSITSASFFLSSSSVWKSSTDWKCSFGSVARGNLWRADDTAADIYIHTWCKGELNYLP